VNLPAPKNHFSKDVSITNILATGKSTVKHIGKYNLSDDRETEMMAVRWRVFNFISLKIRRIHYAMWTQSRVSVH